MNNEQRAKEAARDIGRYGYNVAESTILDALNAATKEKDTRITKLNDALKPFADHYNDETAGIQDKPDDYSVLYSDETEITPKHFRIAAAVREEG